MSLKEAISVDGIGFETGGDDHRYPNRTPRSVVVKYKDNKGDMVKLGTFDTSGMVGKSYELMKFETANVVSDKFEFHLTSDRSADWKHIQLGEIVFYFKDNNCYELD